MEQENQTLEVGKAYKRIDGHMPFDCPYGVHTGFSNGGFVCFEYGSKKLAINGGSYEEVVFENLEIKEFKKQIVRRWLWLEKMQIGWKPINFFTDNEAAELNPNGTYMKAKINGQEFWQDFEE